MENDDEWIKRAIAKAEKTVDSKRVEELTRLFVRIDELERTHHEVYLRLFQLVDAGHFAKAEEDLSKFEGEQARGWSTTPGSIRRRKKEFPMLVTKIPLHHRREYDQVSERVQKLSGWWPMLSMLAGLCLFFWITAPLSTPPMPTWVQPAAIAGTIIFGGPAVFIILKKRSLKKRLRELG